MADEENIEMRDRGPPEEDVEEEEEETRFGDDQRPDPNRSIQIIDTSLPERIRSGFRDLGKDIGAEMLKYTLEKRKFLKEKLNIRLNKKDGPNSTLLFDNIELTWSADEKRINGLKYKGKKIVISKGGDRLDYSSSKANEQTVNEFKELVRKAELEHQKTAASVVEGQVETADDSLIENVVQNTRENLESYIDDAYQNVVEQGKKLGLTENEQREVRRLELYGDDVRETSGVLSGGIHEQEIPLQEKIKNLNIEKNHWLERAEQEGDTEKGRYFKSVARVAELEMDNMRLRMGQKPETDVATNILENETETNDLTRLEKFKKFVKEHFGTISGVMVGIGGIVAAVVVSTRGYVRKGARAAKNFGKGLAKVAEKVGPLVGAVLSLVAKTFDFTAKGLTFPSNHLWLLVVVLFGYLFKKYNKKWRKH